MNRCSSCDYLLDALQTFNDSDICVQKSVNTVVQTLLLLSAQVSIVHRRNTLFETDIGKLMDRHLDFLFGVLRL